MNASGPFDYYRFGYNIGEQLRKNSPNLDQRSLTRVQGQCNQELASQYGANRNEQEKFQAGLIDAYKGRTYQPTRCVAFEREGQFVDQDLLTRSYQEGVQTAKKDRAHPNFVPDLTEAAETLLRMRHLAAKGNQKAAQNAAFYEGYIATYGFYVP